MFIQARSTNSTLSSWMLGLSALVGAGVVSALWNQRVDKRAEQRNPPHGRRIDVDGVVLASGYYFPTARPDVIMSSIATAPLLGDLMNLTISPLIGRLMAPVAFGAMFDPLPIPQRFRDRFPGSLSFRTTQLRASTEEGSMMTGAARRLSSQYGSILAPVTIMAGTSDKIVDFESQSEALHDVLPRSVLKLFPGVGHMVHYAATAEVAAALDNAATAIESLAVA